MHRLRTHLLTLVCLLLASACTTDLNPPAADAGMSDVMCDGVPCGLPTCDDGVSNGDETGICVAE